MGKRGEKLLKELYDISERVSETEMTPVRVGNCRIQGPVDDSDHGQLQRMNSSLSLAAKKLTNMSGGHHMGAEPGTCNVCSAPCSSCMHFNRTLSAMGSKTECGFSGITCVTKEADSFSFMDSNRMPTYKSRICDDSQHAASETSNLLSGSSGHDSYSENAESKATLKPSIACDATEDVDTPLIVPSVETVEDEFLQKKKNVTADVFSPSSSHTICKFCHRTSSSREDEQRGLECHGDNISCISGVRDSNLSAADHNLGNKDAAYCSVATSNLLAEGMKSEVQIEATDTGTENEESQSNCSRPRTWAEGSLNLAGSADPTLSETSGLAEFYLLNNKPSPKVESLGCSSPRAYSSRQNGVIKDLEAPMKIAEPCLEPANDADTGFSSDDLIKTSIVSKQSELPNFLVDASSSMHAKEQPQPIVEGGNSESEIELDVKVCDICGDAGREDLLAICSRCTDGAEHIYCMQKKLRKLPEGDWLCEECRLKEKSKNKEDRQLKKETGNKEHTSETASRTSKDFKHEDTKNKKMDKTEAVSGTSKERKLKDDTENKLECKYETKSLKQSLLNEISHRSLRKSRSIVSPKVEKKVIDPDFRRTPKGDQSVQPSSKRHANSQDVISITSKRTGDTSAENDSPRKKIALFRNSSFKDTGKARPANMLSSPRDQSLNCTQAFSRSQSLLVSNSSNGQGVLHSPHGPLSRSFSFNNINAKPKVKQLRDNVPIKSKAIKSKAARESPSVDTRKEPLVSSLSKSRSFKSGSSVHFNVETASKTQFILQSRGEGTRGMKQMKEKNVMEKKNSSITDQVSGNPVLRAGATIPVPKLDMKIKNDTKLKITSESNVLSVNKEADVPNGIGGDEAKKRLTYSSKSLGGASLSVKCNTEDQRACQNAKEGTCGTFSGSDKFHTNVEAERGILQSAEFAHRDDKTKHISVSSSSRKVVSIGNRMLRCQRCKETGHATQFCSIDKLKSSAFKLSAERNSRDGNTKDSKWKAVVEATITKNRLQKNNSLPDQREEIPICGGDLSFDVATNHQETLRKSEANPTKTVHSRSQPVPPIEASCPPLFADLNATVAVSDELNIKPLSHELPYQASILSNTFRTSAVPELDFIWQGRLDVLTSRRDPEHFDGIQAHLSSCASPKVRDLAIKLSSKVHLEEVSCISTWPWQFQATGPKEENIALFFFAKDVESYERSYSKLLENMIKNDLALRRNLNGVELLIYPSNKLPLNTQRWNRLFYLWGIFRGKGTDCSLSMSSSQKKPSGPMINAGPLVQDLPSSLSSVVPLSEKAALAENTENDSPRCHKSPKSNSLKSATCIGASLAILSSKFEAKMSDVHKSPFHSSSDRSVADSVLPVGLVSYSLPASDPLGNMNRLPSILVTHPESRSRMSRSSQSYPQVKTDETYVENIHSGHGGKPDLDPSSLVHANNEDPGLTRASPANSSGSRLGTESCRSEKKLEKVISMKSEAIFYDKPRGNQMEMDHLSWEKRPIRKRAHSCSTETVSQASVETSRNTDDPMTWMDNINCLPLEDEREQKRMCHGQGHDSSGLKEETLFAKQSSKVHPLASLLNSACEKMPDNSRSKERCFFPVEPSCARTSGLDNVIYILSSDDEDIPESSAPDLELALGDKKRAPKLEAIPLFFQSAQRKVIQEKPQVPAADAEDDISASLSLSLAAPASKAPKPVFKSEQLMPDMPHVNTSLLLFGGFTGT